MSDFLCISQYDQKKCPLLCLLGTSGTVSGLDDANHGVLVVISQFENNRYIFVHCIWRYYRYCVYAGNVTSILRAGLSNNCIYSKRTSHICEFPGNV